MKICVFCESKADHNVAPKMDGLSVLCPVCGNYEIDSLLSSDLENRRTILTDAHRLGVIAQNIADDASRLRPVWFYRTGTTSVSAPDIARFIENYSAPVIRHSDKPNEILLLFARKLANHSAFSVVGFTLRDIYSLKIDGYDEMFSWLKFLLTKGYIDGVHFRSLVTTANADPASISSCSFSITPDGWNAVSALSHNVSSRKAFIAMSFGITDRPQIEASIRAACKESGWEGFTIDNKEYVGGISDEIIASINQSKFVIAEFTSNNHGVYYESGYAAGLGIPVIYVVKQAQLSEPGGLHFDTRHINHIAWTDYGDLQKKLANRISAIIR
jgi:hypothetical protein